MPVRFHRRWSGWPTVTTGRSARGYVRPSRRLRCGGNQFHSPRHGRDPPILMIPYPVLTGKDRDFHDGRQKRRVDFKCFTSRTSETMVTSPTAAFTVVYCLPSLSITCTTSKQPRLMVSLPRWNSTKPLLAVRMNCWSVMVCAALDRHPVAVHLALNTATPFRGHPELHLFRAPASRRMQ